MTSTINIFDRVLKVLARDYPESFLALAVPEVSVRLLGNIPTSNEPGSRQLITLYIRQPLGFDPERAGRCIHVAQTTA